MEARPFVKVRPGEAAASCTRAQRLFCAVTWRGAKPRTPCFVLEMIHDNELQGKLVRLTKAGGLGGAQPPPPPHLQTRFSHHGFKDSYALKQIALFRCCRGAEVRSILNFTRRCRRCRGSAPPGLGGPRTSPPPPPPPAFANVVCEAVSTARAVNVARN